jgi:phage shock protein A
MPVTEFTLRAIFEAEDRLSKSIGNVNEKLSELGEKGEKEGSRLSSTFASVGRTILGVMGGIFGYNLLNQIKNFVEESIKYFAELERESVKLASLSREAGQDIGMLSQIYRTMASAAAKEYAVSARDAMRALESLIKAGLSGRDAITALGSAIQMAKIEGVDFAQASSNLVQVMAQFGLSGQEASRVVDALVNASRRGIGSALEAGTHLNRFLLSLYEVAQKLGVPIRDANGALRDTNAIILDVVRAAKEVGGDFNTLQNRLAGVDVRALKTLFTLMQMTESFEELRSEIGRTGTAMETYGEIMGTTAGKFDQMSATVDRAMQRIGASLSDTAVMLGNIFLPTAQYVFDAWTGIIATATGNAKSSIESWIDSQLLLGRITEQQAAEIIMSWVEVGKITEKEALDIAGRTLSLSTIQSSALMDIIEKYTMLGEEVPEALKPLAQSMLEVQKTTQDTGDVLVNVAKKFDVPAEKALELAKKILGLNLAYDENADLARSLASAYGLTEDQARQLIDALKQESEALKAEEEAARKAKEEEEKHKQALEEARQTLLDSISAILNYGMAYGPLTDSINQATEALKTMGIEGDKIPSALAGLLDFAKKLNGEFTSLEARSRALAGAQTVAATGVNYYNTVVELQRGLVADQIYMLREQIDELRQQEDELRASGDATKQQIEAIRQQREQLELQLQELEKSTSLTTEQAASQERLNAIQQALSFTTQVVTLQQTALQLAMLGADDTANAFMNTSIALADALSDGVITQQEYQNILSQLGITFDEQGQPVINLKGIMEEFRQKLIETRDQINNFRDTLKSIDGLTVHTYHYHHEITVTGTQGGAERPGGYQRGAWYTPEGLAYLHKGEMVLPRPVAEWFRQAGPVTKNINLSINISGAASDPHTLADSISRELVRRLRAM